MRVLNELFWTLQLGFLSFNGRIVVLYITKGNILTLRRLTELTYMRDFLSFQSSTRSLGSDKQLDILIVSFIR